MLARDFAHDGDSLHFAWSLGYLDAHYDEFINTAPGLDVADVRRIQNTPKWTASGTLDYATPVATGLLDQHHALLSQHHPPVRDRTPSLDQPGYRLVGRQPGLDARDDRWTIGLHGKNITDKHYIISGYHFLRQIRLPAIPS